MSNNDTPVPLCDDPETEKKEVPEAELVEDDGKLTAYYTYFDSIFVMTWENEKVSYI